MNNIEELMSEIGRTESAKNAAVAQNLIQRLTAIVKAYKTVYGDDIDIAGEDVEINGQPVATITRTKDGAGEWVVTDPETYARVLQENRIGIPEKYLAEAWQTQVMPRPEACTPTFLARLVRDHDGEPPEGVEYKPGRAGSVRITLEKSFKNAPLTAETLTQSLKLIEGDTK